MSESHWVYDIHTIYWGVFSMTKVDVLDDVIEMLIKKAMDEETPKHNSTQESYKQILRGEKVNGLYSSSGKRK